MGSTGGAGGASVDIGRSPPSVPVDIRLSPFPDGLELTGRGGFSGGEVGGAGLGAGARGHVDTAGGTVAGWLETVP